MSIIGTTQYVANVYCTPFSIFSSPRSSTSLSPQNPPSPPPRVNISQYTDPPPPSDLMRGEMMLHVGDQGSTLRAYQHHAGADAYPASIQASNVHYQNTVEDTLRRVRGGVRPLGKVPNEGDNKKVQLTEKKIRQWGCNHKPVPYHFTVTHEIQIYKLLQHTGWMHCEYNFPKLAMSHVFFSW
jgi:hypothetical protein